MVGPRCPPRHGGGVNYSDYILFDDKNLNFWKISKIENIPKKSK